eukprot:TRINITY_DN41852_c0_g1_i2.p1 TRINITY_DN41852_c0_g1~~TRINITY_DN41852_c0_g1_i2.p1  ORF type:complete len:388 (+),score=55.16 TRINITY_DN41852_c0_g1_i2:131-1294(+)
MAFDEGASAGGSNPEQGRVQDSASYRRDDHMVEQGSDASLQQGDKACYGAAARRKDSGSSTHGDSSSSTASDGHEDNPLPWLYPGLHSCDDVFAKEEHTSYAYSEVLSCGYEAYGDNSAHKLDVLSGKPESSPKKFKQSSQSAESYDKRGVRAAHQQLWWRLIWCYERVHKSEGDPIRSKLSKAVRQVGGKLLCFKSHRVLDAWFLAPDNTNMPFIFMVGRRELKGCLNFLERYGLLGLRPPIVVLGPMPHQFTRQESIRAYTDIEDADGFVAEIFRDYVLLGSGAGALLPPPLAAPLSPYLTSPWLLPPPVPPSFVAAVAAPPGLSSTSWPQQEDASQTCPAAFLLDGVGDDDSGTAYPVKVHCSFTDGQDAFVHDFLVLHEGGGR